MRSEFAIDTFMDAICAGNAISTKKGAESLGPVQSGLAKRKPANRHGVKA